MNKASTDLEQSLNRNDQSGSIELYRYCVNSSSLDFMPETETDGTIRTEESEEIHHPATMGGCSADGTCRLPSRKGNDSVRDRIEVRATLIESSGITSLR